MEKKQNYTIPIIVMFLLFGSISFVTNLASPMSDILSHQFSIPNWQGTLGVFANFIAYAIMGYPAGTMLQKMGYKKTALIAVTVGFVGVGIQTLSGYLASYGVYLLGAFVAGFCMCLLNTVVNPMLTRLGGGGNKGNQLIQFGGSFNSLCGTAVIVLTGLLIPQGIDKAVISDVFPLMYTALGVFALAFVVLLLTRIPESESTNASTTSVVEDNAKGPLSYRHFVLGAIAIFIYVGVEVGIPQILQKWLQNPTLQMLGVENYIGEKQKATAIAGSVAATYWLLMLVGRLLGGFVGSKVSPRKMITAVAVVAILLQVAALVSPVVMVKFPAFNGVEGFGMENIPLAAAFLLLTGLCTSVMWGGIFSLAVAGLGRHTEKASGIFMTLVCGGGILPLIQNFIVDCSPNGTGYLSSYWLVIAGFAYILFYALAGSKNVNKDIVTE